MNLSAHARLEKGLHWLLLGLPVLLLMTVAFAWVLGRIAFGMSPATLIGTLPPKSAIATFACWLVVLTISFGIVVFAIGMLAMFVATITHPLSRRLNLLVLVIAVAGFVAFFAWMNIDPFGMVSWIAWYVD